MSKLKLNVLTLGQRGNEKYQGQHIMFDFGNFDPISKLQNICSNVYTFNIITSSFLLLYGWLLSIEIICIEPTYLILLCKIFSGYKPAIEVLSTLNLCIYLVYSYLVRAKLVKTKYRGGSSRPYFGFSDV